MTKPSCFKPVPERILWAILSLVILCSFSGQKQVHWALTKIYGSDVLVLFAQYNLAPVPALEWQLASKGGTCIGSKRRVCIGEDKIKRGHDTLLQTILTAVKSDIKILSFSFFENLKLCYISSLKMQIYVVYLFLFWPLTA